jgi:hypothetical protein
MKYIKLFETFNSIIAYHGTNKDFDNFNLEFSGTSNDPGDYGKGIYFDTDKEWARSYGKRLITAELLINNPYYINFNFYSQYKKENTNKVNNPELLKFIESLGLENLKGKYDTFLSLTRSVGASKITKLAQNKGYDSIIIDYGKSKEIVVFDVNNIKII